jgi:putative transposase
LAPHLKAGERALDVLRSGAKYSGAVKCLTKDRDALLAFYNFPTEHWDHVRTSSIPLISYDSEGLGDHTRLL